MPTDKGRRVSNLVNELKRLTGDDYAPKRSRKAKAEGVQEPTEQPSTRRSKKKSDDEE